MDVCVSLHTCLKAAAVCLSSVHRAVCDRPADGAGAVQTARGRAAGGDEGNAGQSLGPGEGALRD